MIKTITLTDIYTGLSGISAITDVVELYSLKPDDEAVSDDETYAYLSIVSDNKETFSNIGYLYGSCRLSITVVAPVATSISSSENEGDVIDGVIDAITNAIVNESCSKVETWGNVSIVKVDEGNVTPFLYNDKNRLVKTKDYFITYISKDA